MRHLKQSLFLSTLVLANFSLLGQTNAVYGWRSFVGVPGTSGTNDGTGTAARFNRPGCVAIGSTGDMYLVDMHNNAIRKVTSSGVVTTLAGLAGAPNGTNDGTGSEARFNDPGDVAVDSAGTVYVADTLNHTIRMVTSGGVVTTLAGNASITNQNGDPAGGYADGTGSAARFNMPAAVAVDPTGNLYVADFLNAVIRKVAPVGTNWVVTTLVGSAGHGGSADGTNSVARFSGPEDVTLDSAGNLYVADGNNQTIRKVRPVGTNWVVTTLAGSPGVRGSADGANSAARFYNPYGVAVDSAANVFVPDCSNCTIRKLTPVGTNWVVTTIGGLAGLYGSTDGTGSTARFWTPYGLGVDAAGCVYVADTSNNRISKGIPLPAMSCGRSGASVIVSWPSWATGFRLQQNSSVDNASGWQLSGYTISDNGTNKSITVTSPTDNLFFRLEGN